MIYKYRVFPHLFWSKIQDTLFRHFSTAEKSQVLGAAQKGQVCCMHRLAMTQQLA